jgi:glycosyltransferase (activator-dependent family)
MRILLTTVSERSHVLCLAPLAWALMNAGHEVRLASAPAMADVISSTGATAVVVGSDHELHAALAQEETLENEISDWSEPFEDRQEWELLELKYQVAVTYALQPYNDTIVEDLVEFSRFWKPDLVIWDPITHAGAVAAKAVGAASARLTWCVDVYSRMRQTFLALAARQPVDSRSDPMAAWLGPQLDKYGAEFDEEAVVGQWTVDLIPDSIQIDLPVRRVPTRFTPYNGPAVVPDWVNRPCERPRVLLTPGLSFGKIFGSALVPLKASLDALSDLDVEVVATLNDREREVVGTLPGNAKVVDFVPLHAVLPSCAAVVHHGGFGTWSTAARYGVPQYLVPIRMADMWIKAQRTVAYGAGLCSHPTETTAQMVRDGVRGLLEEECYRRRAAMLREEIEETPGASEVVADLVRLTREHRS